MVQRKIILHNEEPSPTPVSFNAERVAELKAAIEQGRYRIDIPKLAQALAKFEKQFFSS